MKRKLCVCVVLAFVFIFFAVVEAYAVCLEAPSGMMSWWPGDGNTSYI